MNMQEMTEEITELAKTNGRLTLLKEMYNYTKTNPKYSLKDRVLIYEFLEVFLK